MITENKVFDWETARARLRRAEQAVHSATSHSDEDLKQIFDRRAASLATPLAQTEDLTGSRIVFVRVGEERYGIPLQYVLEVVEVPRIAPAPGAPAGILGLMQNRGQIRVVWSLGHLLGTGTSGSAVITLRNILIVRHGNIEIGLAVEEAEEIRLIEETNRRPASSGGHHALWMTQDLTPVLDMETLLASTNVGNH